MVNIDKLREKYEQIQNAQSGGGNNDFLKKFFMMEEGTSQVRVLPSGNPDNDFYAETAIHRIDEKNYHCPRVKGDACPVCDLYYKLWKMGIDGAEDLARSIKPRKRYYLNVVDRRDESVKILSVGMKLFGKILDCFFDEDFGDITDLKEGWDFKIVKDTQGQWPNYDKSSPKPKQTEAGTEKQTAEWMDELHDIHGLIKVAEYDDLKNMAMEMEAIITGRPTGNTSQEKTTDSDEDEDYLAHLKSIKVD